MVQTGSIVRIWNRPREGGPLDKPRHGVVGSYFDPEALVKRRYR